MTPARLPFSSSREDIAEGVVLFVLAGAPNDEEFAAFLGDVARFLRSVQRRGELVSLVLDPSGLTRFDASMRKAYGEWRAANMVLIRHSCARAAYVTQSALGRGILTAVFWIAPPAIPVETFSDRDTAIAWVNARRG